VLAFLLRVTLPVPKAVTVMFPPLVVMPLVVVVPSLTVPMSTEVASL
jgi:hypothetical protein